MENLKNRIHDVLKDIGKRENFKEILEVTKGVPVSILAMETGNPPIDEMRKTICELWDEDKITIWSCTSHLFHKEIFRSLLDNDAWFLSAGVALISEEDHWIVCR